jgi:hypothetical protein
MAQAQLQTNLSHNEQQFKINQFVTLAKVDQTDGLYIYHDPDEESRIPNTQQFLWADGADAPNNFLKGQSFIPYHALRWAKGFVVGAMTQKNCTNWDIVADQAVSATRALMNLRSYNVYSKATTAANWVDLNGNAQNTSTVSSISGSGYWDEGTSTTPYIQVALNYAIQQIELATNGAVGAENLTLVLGPKAALKMSQTDEIRNYYKGSYWSKEFMENADNGNGYRYGLGPSVYGIKVIVDNAVVNTAQRGQARNAAYQNNDVALLVCRPNDLQGPLNTMGTITLAMFEDVNVITEFQGFEQRTRGEVFDIYDTILRPNTGYLFTSLLSS